jgi:hypothetical protein
MKGAKKDTIGGGSGLGKVLVNNYNNMYPVFRKEVEAWEVDARSKELMKHQ